MKNLREIVKEKILILDGAMGTEIQKYNLTEEDFRGERFRDLPGMMKGNNDMLNITRPDVISDIYRRYLEAGADIITANTFSCQRISQADYHLENCAREMAFEGARLARIECDKFSTPDKPRFVAGDVGPTNKTCSMSPDVSNPAAREITYDELFTDVCEQVDGLIEGGADVILIETIFDTLNCKAMIDAALTMMKKHGVELPVMISLTVSDLAGRTLSGQTVDAFLASLSPYPIFSVGMNCAFGAPQMKPFIEHMAQVAPYYISAHPNAGLPNEMGEYDETAESMAPQIAEFIDEGIVNIIGGCCGTSPEFIAHYARIAEGKKPHQVVEKPKYMWLSGLDLLQVDDSVHLPVDASRFINVGERCNVAGSRKFLRLINEKNYEEAIGIARKQVADGAAVVDVNMDDGLLDAKAEMVNFLRKDITEEILIRLHILYLIRTVHRIEIIADRMTIPRERLAVYPGRNIRVGIAEQDYTVALLLKIAESNQIAFWNFLHVAQPAMLQFLEGYLAAYLLAHFPTVFLLGNLALFQLTVQANLLIRVHLLRKLLHTQLNETFACLILVEGDDNTTHIKNHSFNHIIILKTLYSLSCQNSSSLFFLASESEAILACSS
jgi:5-methyltetrahydrofolate--homocysteine methyltransferase